jgi:hypothetical protein
MAPLVPWESDRRRTRVEADGARPKEGMEMPTTTIRAGGTLASAALALAVACGPIPGGSLAGRVTAPPADWSTVVPEQHRFCEIESRPADPHSIQLDCFLHEGSLYVQSHRWALASWWPVESWAAVWIAHPDVRVRIGDALYELAAVRVTEGAERERVLAFRGYDPVPAGVVLFRFAPRA